MTLGEVAAESGVTHRQVVAFLRPRWRSLTAATVVSGVVAVGAGGVLHWLMTEATSVSALTTCRWIGCCWLVLAGAWWAGAVLRAMRPRRRVVLLTAAAMALAVFGVLPGGTWWTFATDHAAAQGSAFDSSAVGAFFGAAFSQYREPLTVEGEMRIGASVDPAHRSAVLDRVRQVRSVLDAPVPGEVPPADRAWQHTRYDLAMTRQLSGEPGRLRYEVVAEETYPTSVYPYWGNARLGATVWTFAVRQDRADGWWIEGFTHPDVCAAYRYGHGCQVTDPTLLPHVAPSPSPRPSSTGGEGFRNWEMLPCGPRDPLREFHHCPSAAPSPVPGSGGT